MLIVALFKKNVLRALLSYKVPSNKLKNDITLEGWGESLIS